MKSENTSPNWTMSMIGARAALGTLCLLLVLLASSLGCNRDPKARAEKHFASGQSWLSKGRLDEAAIEFRRSIQLDPKMAKAHFELARLFLGRGAVGSAFQELNATLKYEPQHREANLLIGEILVGGRQFEPAKNRAEAALKLWPDEVRAKLTLAESSFGLGDAAHARQIVDSVLTEQPNNPRALLDLAALQAQSKDWGAAEASLRRGAEASTDSLTALLALSNLLEFRGDLGGAESALKEAMERKPSLDLPMDLVLGTFYVRHKRLSDAEPLFRTVAQKGKTSEQRSILARFYRATGRLPEAENEYKRILAADDHDWPNWMQLADLYFSTNRRAEARQVSDRLIKERPKDWATLALRGQMELEDGNPDQALTYLQQARQSDPAAVFTHFHIARAYARKGDFEQAKGSLGEALKREPGFLAARAVLAELQLRTGETDAAVQNLDKVLADKPGAVEPNILLSQAYLVKGEVEKADQNLSRLLGPASKDPIGSPVLRLMGWVKLRQGKFKEAGDLARRSIELAPNSVESLYLLGASYFARKQPEQGIEAVAAYVNKAPNWAEGYAMLGQICLQAGKAQHAQQSFSKALEINPKHSAAMIGLGTSYVGLKQLPLARATFERLTEQDSGNGQAWLNLGGVYEAQGEWEKAKAAYQKSLNLQPDPIAKNNLAWLYVEHGGNLDLALKLAQEAREAAPEDPRVADTLAWVCIHKGTFETAVQYLKESVKKMPENGTYHYHLGVAYYKMGNMGKAKETLNAALARGNFAQSDDAKKLLASLNKNNGKPE